MSEKRSYLAAAFNARPFGMPVPPNWFMLAAFGLLGGFVNPGFWLIGLGLEIGYLWLLAHHPRFRKLVDATRADPATRQYYALLERLDDSSRELQQRLAARCAEIIRHLQQNEALDAQSAGLTRLCWLHLRLLVARNALASVVATARKDARELTQQQERIERRLAATELDDALKRSLEQQLGVIRTRLEAHADAERRLELVNAELERIRQQVALVHDQALLATDAEGITRSIDVLAASLREANQLLQEQREVLSDFDDLSVAPPSSVLFGPFRQGRPEKNRMKEET